MKALAISLPLLILAGCASIKYDGMTFSSHKGSVQYEVPYHGFADIDSNQKVCGEQNTFKAGYFVELRQPRKGETESEYQQYEKAESVRAELCADAALWCSTELNILCSPNDNECLKDKPMGIINTCRIKVVDARNKPHLHSIIDMNGWVNCGGASDAYTSTVAKTGTTTGAWNKDLDRWQQHCLKHRRQDECDSILKDTETQTYFIRPDANRWAIQISNKTSPRTERDHNKVFSTIEVDASPSCYLLEKRH